MVRQLIINADDLGLTNGVNRAIIETHRVGVVTSATLMANGAAFEGAIKLLSSALGLSVGCHVVLVDGTPILPPDQISSLLASRSGHPDQFHSRLSPVAARAVFGGFDPDELTNEIVAQIRKLQAAGVQVTHLDTHKHTHIFPSILKALMRAARICAVPAIRNPFVPTTTLSVRQFGKKPALWKRFGQVRMLRTFAGKFRDRMKRSALAAPDGIFGVIETGAFNLNRLRETLQDLPDGIWELVCHPGYNDDDLRRANTRLLDSREQERKVLTSSEMRDFLVDQEIRLIGYQELIRSEHSAAGTRMI